MDTTEQTIAKRIQLSGGVESSMAEGFIDRPVVTADVGIAWDEGFHRPIAASVATMAGIGHTIYAPYSDGGIGIWGWMIVAVFAGIAVLMIGVLLLQGAKPGALRKYVYWRQWAAPAIIIILVVYGVRWAYPDSRIRLAKLRGLTPPEVVAHIGPPTDKRHALPPGSSNGKSLLVYDYQGGWGWEYEVMFGTNDRGKYVVVGRK